MEVFKTTIKEEEVEFNDDFQIDPDEILNFCLTFNSLNNPTIDEFDNNNDLFGAIKLENVEEQLVDDPPKLDCLLCEKIFSTSPNLFKHFQSWIHQAKEAGLHKKVFKMEVPDICSVPNYKLDTFYPDIKKEKIDDDQQVPISMPKLDTQEIYIAQEYPGTDNQASLFQFDSCKDPVTSHQNNLCDFSAFKYPEIRNQVVPTSSCQFNNNYIPQIDLPTNPYYFNHQTHSATDQVVPQSSYQYQNVDYCYPPLIPFYEPEFSYSNFLAPTYSLFNNLPQPVHQLPLFLPFQFNNDKNSIQQSFLDINNNNLHQSPIGHSTKSIKRTIDKTPAPKSIPEVKIKEEPILEFPIQIKVEKNANDEYDIIFEDYKYEFATEQLQPPKKKRNVSQKMYCNIEDGFKCTFCSKEYSTSSNLIRHMNLHLNAKIYKCPYCPSSFQQQEYWKKHTDTHRRNRILNNVNSKLM